jgi:hypothetical protein
MPARVYHSAGARLDVSSISLIAEVINLFDQRTVTVPFDGAISNRYPISDFLGYPLPGRRFNLVVRGTL